MSRRVILPAVAALVLLASCDGAREDAGEKVDANAGVVLSEDTIASGPAETSGEVQDRAADSAEDAVKARADAAEDRADAVRSTANQKADVLEQQAREIRARADKDADAAEARAIEIRNK